MSDVEQVFSEPGLEAAELRPDQESSEPLDLQRTNAVLVTQPYDVSIASHIEDIDSGRLLLELEYQRSYVWDDAKPAA